MGRPGVKFLVRVAIACTYFATLVVLHRHIAPRSSKSLVESLLSIHKSQEDSVTKGTQDTNGSLKSIKVTESSPLQLTQKKSSGLKEPPKSKGSSKPLGRTESSLQGRKRQGPSTVEEKSNKRGSSKSSERKESKLSERNTQENPDLKERQRLPDKRLKLEPLNRTNHFRSEIFLPYFLGAQIDFNKYERRVLLDIGAKTFGSSIKWFLNNYPGGFTEIHAFEAKPGVFIPPPPESDILGGTNLTAHETRVDIVNTEKSVDIVDFMLNNAKLKKDDIVVVKMSVKGDEWKLLERMEKGQVFPLIDEMMVNVHYNHPMMPRYGWQVFKHTRDEAYNLFRHLRDDLGVFVHPWP